MYKIYNKRVKNVVLYLFIDVVFYFADWSMIIIQNSIIAPFRVVGSAIV